MTTPAFREWLRTLAEAEATIPARIVLDRLPEVESEPARLPKPQDPDKLLTVDEAAKRLGVDKRWVYRHAHSLPFTRRLTAGTLRFSERGLERWKDSRA